MSNVHMLAIHYSLIATALIFFGSGAIYRQIPNPSISNTSICNSLATYFPYPLVAVGDEKGGDRTVSVDVLISEIGNVLLANAISGAKQYRSVAEATATKAKFRVTTNRGVPVKVKCRVVYYFAPKRPSIRVIDCSKCNENVISIPEPKYPGSVGFGAHKYNGVVSIQVSISVDGKVESARGISGHPFFKEYLEREIQEAKFKPTLVEGKPVKVTVFVWYQVISPD